MFTLTIPVSSACLPWVLGMLVIGPQSSMNGSVSMIIGMHSILRAAKMLAGIGTVHFARMWNHRFFFFPSSHIFCIFFPTNSLYYFIVGKKKINKNKQISGCYDEKIGWEHHYLASLFFQDHSKPVVWKLAAGNPAQPIGDEHPQPLGWLQIASHTKFRGLATSGFHQVGLPSPTSG